jgi:hypothetical protein
VGEHPNVDHLAEPGQFAGGCTLPTLNALSPLPLRMPRTRSCYGLRRTGDPSHGTTPKDDGYIPRCWSIRASGYHHRVRQWSSASWRATLTCCAGPRDTPITRRRSTWDAPGRLTHPQGMLPVAVIESPMRTTVAPLSWIADRPGVIAPVVGARTVEHLRNNLGAAELTLNNEGTTVLEKVSAPQAGGYPYGAFGAGQRARWLQDGTPAPTPPYAAGSHHPTGRA